MTGKRKRARQKHRSNGESWKKAKTDHSSGCHPVGGGGKAPISHPLLSLYYPRVFTLRDFFLSRLPPHSKAKQRRIASLGIAVGGTVARAGVVGEKEGESDRLALARLLDSTLVGVPIGARSDSTGRLEELEAFSQHHPPSANSAGGAAYSQSEVSGLCFPFSPNPTPVSPRATKQKCLSVSDKLAYAARRLSTS
jgi:telomerase reverse transcriptase